MPEQSAVIELEHVAVKIGTTKIHRDISLCIGCAETVTLLGPSGTGKTVLLKTILGLIKPSSGRVSVLGAAVEEMSEDELNRLRMRIGMLFQGAALFDSLNVFENVAYALREHGEADERRIAAIVGEKLNLVGLPGIGAKSPAELSGGQKKRVALARALASNPEVILFDEPTTGLDPTSRRLIDDLIIRLREEFGITGLVVTHDIESARRISTRWILIHNGRVVADGSVEELAGLNPEVVDFISGNWQPEAIVAHD